MSKTKEYERIWCHKNFKILIKSEAAKRGYPSIKDFTEDLAKQEEPIKFIKNDSNKKRKWKFNI